ncbi:MAG: DUF1211 domain-containing protein [Calditrichaeota bacterium]|nr:MAG: DUF1211 domain-containing protein [Calditrichota bacterium]MBL1206755.1 DUF1211 domain-containing protein [Calditrichota bacterium]NOG46581.1 DUF1211 domain-containing protein [Calditrichota bacterium]
MIREHLFNKRAPADPMFRWRGGDISRLEGLSDGVFAVTLTLLVVSVNVPVTFYELWLTIKDLPIFLVSFLMLMMAWRYHYIFFRRYGLEDFVTSLLNGAFLFLILFFAYPLKFLATFLWRITLNENPEKLFILPEGVTWLSSGFFQQAGMMYFYGIGIIGVFGILALLVYRAYRLRSELELDELECYLTISSIRANLITVGIAILSILVLLFDGQPGYAGIVYFLMGPIHGFAGFYTGKKANEIQKKMIKANLEETEST